MPYVEGESLRGLLNRERQLSFDEALRITREVAEALGHAHSYGLVHRDIKPENVLLSDGHAVVADFGVARAVSCAGGVRLTDSGLAVGTPAYMSPEQAAADEQVDGRADIYSLGCVMYEMLVGQAPFTGPTPQAIMARHSMDEVPLPHIVRQSIPLELEAVLLCTLEKTPADRFHTAGELVEALDAVSEGRAPHVTVPRVRLRVEGRRRRWPMIAVGATGGVALVAAGLLWLRPAAPIAETGLDPRDIAVLYFDDLSADSSLGYVADGLTEGLIRQLAGVSALSVISPNGVAPYRARAASRESIATALEVGTLIEGSVASDAGDLRVLVELVDGVTGAGIERWTFELPVQQLLVTKDSIGLEVADALRVRLGQEIRLRRQRAETGSIEAWSLVQRGERFRKDAEALLQAGDYDGCLAALARADSLTAAAEMADPEWSEPPVIRGWLAYERARLAAHAQTARKWVDEAVGHAERALAVDPGHPRALELRGTASYYGTLRGLATDVEELDRILAAAERDLQTAVEGDPSLARAHGTLSHLYLRRGDRTSAALAARRAYEADAYLRVADAILARLFWAYYDLGEHTQAARWCNEGRRRFPEDPQFCECQLFALTTEAVEPDVDGAWALAHELAALAPEPEREYYRRSGQILVGGTLARAGLADSARNVLARARAGPEVDPSRMLVYDEAHVRVMLGDEDEAIDLLKTWLAAHPEEDHGFGPGGEVYWWWRDLRDHPRFGELTAVGR